MRVHFVIHELFEAPGELVTWAESRGHDVGFSRVYAGEKLPSLGDFDLLIVMGGPQSPETTLEECPHFDAEAEMELIRQSADSGKLVLGVCLGAQLIGHAFGGNVERSPNREIGFYPVTLTKDAERDPAFAKFPSTFLSGHWHGDMPGLTPDAVVLASSDGCPRQIIRYQENVYAFQCHMELNPEVVELLIEYSTEELEQNRGMPYVQQSDELRKGDHREMNALLFSFMDALVDRFLDAR